MLSVMCLYIQSMTLQWKDFTKQSSTVCLQRNEGVFNLDHF